MKEFMLIYVGGDPDWKKNASPDEMKAAMDRWGVWMANLQEKNQLVTGGSPLHYEGKRMDPDGVVTDIASSEFKELVSGYSIVAAENIEQALKITKECPIFDYPGILVEVREVMQMG